MRVRLRDPPITVVDLQLGLGIAADFAGALNRLLLGAEVPTGTRCSATTDIPSIRTVEYDGKRVTYASDGEMAAALADLNRQIAGAAGRVSVVRIQSSKGL